MSLLLMARRGAMVTGGGPSAVYSNTFESGSTSPTTSDLDSGSNPANTFLWGNTMEFVSAVSPITGTYSMRFPYVGSPTAAEYSIGQNFKLPFAFEGGIGMEWDQRVGSNFVLRGPSSTHKWFQMWQSSFGERSHHTTIGASMQRYGDESGKVELLEVVTRSGGSGEDRIAENAGATYPSVHGAILISPLAVTSEPVGIIVPGQVHKIRYLAKFATSSVATDGRVEFWVDDTLFSYWDGPLYSPISTGYPTPSVQFGTLMGSSNSGYADDTTWTWDNLKFYNTTTRWW